MAKILIKKMSDISVKDCFEYTPLHLAAKYNKNPDIIKILIENGAKINALGTH